MPVISVTYLLLPSSQPSYLGYCKSFLFSIYWLEPSQINLSKIQSRFIQIVLLKNHWILFHYLEIKSILIILVPTLLSTPTCYIILIFSQFLLSLLSTQSKLLSWIHHVLSTSALGFMLFSLYFITLESLSLNLSNSSQFLSTAYGDCEGEKLGTYPGGATQKASLLSGEEPVIRPLPRRHFTINIGERRQFSTCE